MKLAFYPGCSLEGMANDYAHSIIAVFKHLDIELVEIEDWSCCGATAAHSLNEMMAVNTAIMFSINQSRKVCGSSTGSSMSTVISRVMAVLLPLSLYVVISMV